MTEISTEPGVPDAFFHPDSDAVRFWVRMPSGGAMGASVARRVLQFRFKVAIEGGDALQTYRQHRPELEAAVLRRVAKGSIEPVLLREPDLA